LHGTYISHKYSKQIWNYGFLIILYDTAKCCLVHSGINKECNYYLLPGVKSSCVGCEEDMELDDALEHMTVTWKRSRCEDQNEAAMKKDNVW
jgi:hypothetical protein